MSGHLQPKLIKVCGSRQGTGPTLIQVGECRGGLPVSSLCWWPLDNLCPCNSWDWLRLSWLLWGRGWPKTDVFPVRDIAIQTSDQLFLSSADGMSAPSVAHGHGGVHTCGVDHAHVSSAMSRNSMHFWGGPAPGNFPVCGNLPPLCLSYCILV